VLLFSILKNKEYQYMQHGLSPSARRVFGTAPLPEVNAGPDGVFLETLRANLHAASRHAALGHKGSSFRECPGPACIEAAKLIPELDPIQGTATEAELDTILDQVLNRLETEGTSFFVPKPS
jgi:hypothetical protein